MVMRLLIDVTCRPAIIAPISSMYVLHPVYKHRVNAQ